MRDLFLKLRAISEAFLASEHGQDLPEYALTAVMIAFGAVAGMDSIASGVCHVFNAVANTLDTAV